jgi:hypothetical protein
MPQSNPRIHSASSFATSHCETSNNDVPIFLGNESHGPIVDAEIRYLRGIGSQRLQDLVTPKFDIERADISAWLTTPASD